MIAELIAVGSELLRFGRSDTNGDWITERLQRLGVEVVGRSLVGDDHARTAAAIRAGLATADLVVLTGGLGPTEDDRARAAIADALGVPLERDEMRVARLRRFFEDRGREFKPEQSRQADRPVGAEWIENDLGIAPGILARRNGRTIVALPGVPAEMKRMFTARVAPLLAGSLQGALARRLLKIGGRFESSVDAQVRDLYDTPGVEVTILTGREGIELHLLARGGRAGEARERLEALDRRFADRLGVDLYGRDDETLGAVTGHLLVGAGATVATAESCTAGLLAATMTDVPGSSSWFRGGLVVYSNDLKVSLAGVDPGLIEAEGAVSEGVARALASGARSRCGADYGVGITGIAGPGGGTPDKPVGRVHVALADPVGQTDHWQLQQIGGRELVRRRTVVFALDRLRRALLSHGAG
jgi:nicotinamide-nucleotide amidase